MLATPLLSEVTEGCPASKGSCPPVIHHFIHRFGEFGGEQAWPFGSQRTRLLHPSRLPITMKDRDKSTGPPAHETLQEPERSIQGAFGSEKKIAQAARPRLGVDTPKWRFRSDTGAGRNGSVLDLEKPVLLWAGGER